MTRPMTRFSNGEKSYGRNHLILWGARNRVIRPIFIAPAPQSSGGVGFD
jgi:hypothetical protein